MIEFKNVKKTYKSKKGLATEALKGIDLCFGEKGLTFILGKSGSGKSTLLNIIGGLDTYTSGDILINGKSTKEFKNSDWDNYRNTYMGFVFQEFNLLDNYTVLDNLKLALDLQSKKISDEELIEALDKVQLQDVLKRKPNELSGGQKQRIAIARALIKDPEIILADEPTGNLDSETSEQIFKILKNLSKDKLVIVVSHDRESAEKYADRIVTISDGLIENDTLKKNPKVNKELKLRKAKLPFYYSFKMGLGNLFHKKIRLFFSSILILLSLICFGLMISVLNVDINKEVINSVSKYGSTEVSITKYDRNVDYEEIAKEDLKHFFDKDVSYFPDFVYLDQAFLDEVNSKTNMKWNPVYTLTNNYDILSWKYKKEFNGNDSMYYYSYTTMMWLIKTDALDNLNVIGSIPSNDDEVVISSFIAESIINYGVGSKKILTDKNENDYYPTSFEQIINDDIYINLGDFKYVKIVGIVDYRDYLKKYDELKMMKEYAYWDLDFNSDEAERLINLKEELASDKDFLNRVYVTDGFIKNLEQKEKNLTNTSTKIIFKDKTYDVFEFGYLEKNKKVFTKNGIVDISDLEKNEIIINKALLDSITNGDYSKKLEENMFNEDFNESVFLNSYLRNNGILGSGVKTSIKDKVVYNDPVSFGEYIIKGVIDDGKDSNLIYYNKDYVNDLITSNLGIFYIFREVDSTSDFETILKYYPVNNSNVLSSCSYSKNLLSGILITIMFKTIGEYGTLLFLVFSVVLLMNFISNSIKYRKKEIGILRALGCRGIDILSMFIYECLILVFICLGISFAIIPSVIKSVNELVISEFGVKINLMNFGFSQASGVVVIMIVIVILSTIIPLRKLIKSKPIDTILDK